MTVRRVVTGETPDGRHVVVSDEAIEPRRAKALAGVDMHYLWGSDTRFSVPTDGTEPPWREHFPPTDGVRLILFGLAPATLAGHDGTVSEADLREADEQFPGLLGSFDDDDAGAHASTTVDFAVVLRGEITLEVDDGERRDLAAGDVVVQNGTRHKWTNNGSDQALVAFVLLGASARSHR